MRAGDDIERLLVERGRDVGVGPTRVAAGPSGIAVGFPEDPMLHVSWWALLLALVLVAGFRRRPQRRHSVDEGEPELLRRSTNYSS